MRIKALLDGYGPLPDFDLIETATERIEATIRLERSLAERWIGPQRTWVAEGNLGHQADEIDWIRSDGHLLT